MGASAPALRAQWTAIPLQPDGYRTSQVNAVSATRQYGYLDSEFGPIFPTQWQSSAASWTAIGNPGDVGYVQGAGGAQLVGHLAGSAALWDQSGTGYTNLGQPGWWASYATATDGTQQVGFYYPVVAAPTRAVLWHGSASSMVELQPSGAYESQALAASPGLEGGGVLFTASGNGAAILWAGSAESYVILSPAGSFGSQINGMSPGQQVGAASFPGVGIQAAMWSGTAASYVDMAPPGSGVSDMLATCGSAQVGWANLGGVGAGIWFGTPESFIWLQPYLPPGYFESVATSVAFDGTRYYVGGYALQNISGEPAAFLWIGVPGPGSVAVLVLGAAAATRRRRS